MQKNQLLYDDNKSNYNKNNNTNNNRSDSYTTGPATSKNWGISHLTGLCGDNEILNNGTSEWGTSITNNVSVNNTNTGTWGHTIPQQQQQQQQQQQSTTQGNNQNWANLNSGGGGGPSNQQQQQQQQQQSQQGIINKSNNNNNNNNNSSNNNSSNNINNNNNNNGTGGCLPSGNNQRQINNTNQTIDISIGVGNNVNNCNVGNNMNGKIIGNSSQQQQQSGGVVSGGGNIVSGGQSNQQQQQQQNNSQQQPPNGQSGLNGNNSGNNNSGNNHTNNGGNSGLVGGGTSAVAAKNQLEQLNTMREALFSQDGWGCQHVNQDTNWDVPGSPEPTSKSDPPGPSMWKPNINNGTELWEANLRNGGQPPPQPAQKTPWGPSTNLGGTWGEDDDGADASNVWTGTPANPSGPQWTQPVGGIWPPAGAAAATQKKESEWGNSIATGNAWGDPRDLRAAPMDIRSVDPRDLRTPSADPREMRIIDPRESIRDMRGDPRGISGRLNGASEMWGQHHALTHGQIALNKMVGPTAAAVAAAAATGVNNAQWGSTQSVTGPKEIAMASKPTGWEEPSPPPQRRNIPNYDDGTSLWGPQSRVPLVSNWKDIPDMSRNNIIRGAIANQSGVGGAGAGTTTPMPPPRIGPNTQVKPDNNMWGHAAPGNRNNGAWDEQHTSANWDDKTTSIGNIGGAGWNDTTTSAAWSKNQNKIGSAAQVWPETDLGTEWGGAHAVNKSQPKLGGLTSETIRGSKPYRLLLDMGFKKEESEVTLRATNLNFDEAIELLNGRTNAPIDSWRRHDDPNVGFDHTSVYPGRFPAGPQPTMSFPPNNNPNIMNNVGGGGVGTNTGLAALNNMQPLQVTKYLSQAQQNVSNSQTVPGFGQVTTGNHNSGQPSAQQLRMLVQQIQMAVQGGYLSSQILNQPLAPTTLILLNQLLSIIKHLQGAQTSLSRNPINSLPLTVTITKYKQQISSLQNQINAQQALYVKQQQQATSHIGSSNAEYLRGHDAISALQGNFSEINLNKDQPGVFQGAPNQQSRLNQWKLPVLEKEASSDSTDFSRAPGPTAKPSLPTSSSNNIATLGLSNDGTWSSARNISDGWPDPNNENENKDWPAAQPSPATAFTDLVPEFEPGKPWKGSQIKTIEDDPSITPGSVARSPLSINPTPKDADIFVNSSKTSPTDLAPLSLSSSTWSFNPSGNQQNFTSWSDNAPQPSATTSELWTAPMNKSSRGPPPGLGANKASVSGAGSVAVTNPSAASGSTNGWMSSGLTGRVPSGNSNWSGANTGNWHSTWLLLKNLTTQIDGSTLRTLCMQHGPLQNFHLYLNQGIALCKYSTREEANKAQMALNNCVLGNTTICAESPNESEVQNILQHLPAVGQSQSGAGGSGGGSGGGGGGGGSSGGQSSWRPQSQNPSRPAEL